MILKININGSDKEFNIKGDETLLHVLRDNGYREVKNGCEEGQCGACLVLCGDNAINSCQVLAASFHNKCVKTVKGIGTLRRPSIIQEAYVDSGAIQCGFCTPGFVIATYALLNKNPDPTDEEIKRALDGNLCRCTGYIKIIDAVKLAAQRLAEVNE